MIDESNYLTTYEAALAVVATGMKKARLPLDTLVINSFLGGLLFATGGMLHVMVQSELPEIHKNDPGIVFLIQGLVYPIGLFYVVVMGVELFNSNILYFTVAYARRAVSLLDVTISWMVSYWFNLVGNIFVCYIICHYSHVTSSENFISGSIAIVEAKVSYTFTQTLIKAMAGNFFVCLAIYLQLMAKPLHVKFMMMVLPIFSFVSMGFTHAVADMFVIVIGLVNKAPVPVREVAWKVFLPGAIGNIIGGCFFSLLLPYYLHIVVVERDQRLLKLPKYDIRDEQPDLNQDSRVVRQMPEEKVDYELETPEVPLNFSGKTSSSSLEVQSYGNPQALVDPHDLSRVTSRFSRATSRSVHQAERSPANVFPVYGMGPPLERERSIASGRGDEDNDTASVHTAKTSIEREPSAAFIGEQLRRALGRIRTEPNVHALSDLESQHRVRRTTSSHTNFSEKFRRPSYSRRESRRSSNKYDPKDLGHRMSQAGLSNISVRAADDVAGIATYSMSEVQRAYHPDNHLPECPSPTRDRSSEVLTLPGNASANDENPASYPVHSSPI